MALEEEFNEATNTVSKKINKTLTDEELKEIGIPTFGARKKLLLLARGTKKKLGVA